eukprot:12117421-Ditylum_brightwellii.AAC.1
MASFKTVAGKLYTARVVKTAFQLTELNLGVYNMTLGRDVLKSLGIILNHSTETITWDDTSIPMKVTSVQAADSFHIKDSKGIENRVGRIAEDKYKTIIKAKYEKADLKK